MFRFLVSWRSGIPDKELRASSIFRAQALEGLGFRV